MMDRSRETRRVNMAVSNSFVRRRHRSSSGSLRDSPEDDGPVELHESAGGRLRDRGGLGKKDRDRDRERDRDRDRERERDRDRAERERDRMMMAMSSGGTGSSRSKRRRGERLLVHHHQNHHGGGHVGGEDSSEESVNEDEDEDDDDGATGAGSSMRMLPPNHNNPSSSMFSSSSASFSNHSHHHNNSHQQNHHGYNPRKSFLPQQPPHPPPTPLATTVTTLGTASNKVFRSSQMSLLSATMMTATTAPPWASDEMIGVSVPRKARSAHTKRSHESWVSNGVGAVVGSDQIHRQASASPVRSIGSSVPGILASASASPVVAPVSPSSSNASVKKKMKPNGPKQRPPKSSSSKSASSAQDEIEIEIAEVLYGLRQPQGPTVTPKLESSPAGGDSLKFDLREQNNKPAGDAKSRVSSPISNSPSSSTVPAQSSSLPNITNSSSSAGTSAGAAAPVSAIAPKRKRPRPVKYEDDNPTAFPVRNSPISSTMKVDADQLAKAEACSPNLEKTSGSVSAPVENGGGSDDLPASQTTAPSSKEPQLMVSVLDSQPSLTREQEAKDLVLGATKEEPGSPKESPTGVKLDEDRENLKATNADSAVSEVETQRGEKFEIDLMAPPPVRSSPERDSGIDFVAVGPKPMVTEVETELKPHVVEDDDKRVAVKIGKEDINLEPEEKRTKVVGEEDESLKPIVNKERNIDLQLDLEKTARDGASISASGTKMYQNVQKQQQQQQIPNTEKSVAAQTNPLPLPMSMAGWPGGLPHMGYMAPLQGVVSMEGNALASAAIQPPHLQQRPKRCATHCYIARLIHYQQQLSRMNPFWPAAAGSALPYAAKMSILPSPELHASRGGSSMQEKGHQGLAIFPGPPGKDKNPFWPAAAGSALPYAAKMTILPSPELHASRGGSSMQEKGHQGLAIFPGPPGKDKNTPAANNMDPAQRKQILLQQPLPPGAPNNILHSPAFIFPLSQQQAEAAAFVRPGTIKSPPASGGALSSSGSASIAAAATAVAGAPAMSFNYPNMAGNETPYLAILQNGAYSIPIPSHVGTTPAYRGTHPQAVPFFNGSFYSSQMLNPSQLQQQQLQPPPPQSQHSQRGHQNPSISSGSSSSQKHLQSQQQKSHGNDVNGGGANLQGFPAPKNQSSQSLQFQQRQQLQNLGVPPQAPQLVGELESEDSPSTADSRVSRANTNIYGQNFVVPIHPPNFTFMNPVAMSGANGVSGNPGEKKQQQSQLRAPKAGVDSLPSQAFAVSFASINGATASGFDISSIAHNSTVLHSLPEAARHGYHLMAASAAQAQQQKKSFRVPDDGKTGGNDDASTTEEDRKAVAGGKTSANAGQSIAFSRPDLTDASVTSMAGNTVIDTSARSLNLGSSASRTSGSVISPAVGNVNAPGVQQQLQRAQQQQMIPVQKHQQQFAVSTSASVRGKTPATSNGSIYSDHISSSPSSVPVKFPNTVSAFPQSIVQSSSTVQSPQWKNSVRTTISQVASPLASNSPVLKNLPQQQSRTQVGHTQISFGASPKSTTSTSNHAPSSTMVVGSPTTSISKIAGGSPRTTSTSTSNKGGQTSTLSSQQVKNSASMPTQKSSPVGGRNVQSILSHPHMATSPGSTAKSQLSQQQQLSKLALPYSPMFASSYIQSQAPHATSSTNAMSGASGFCLQRHRGEQQQQPQAPSASSSTGMLSLCTADPAKAAAAAVAASNMKGGGLHYAQFAAAQVSGKSHQLVPAAGFPYVHPVPTVVQVKPADQKHPAGE